MTPSIELVQKQLEHGDLGLPELLSLRRTLGAPFKLHPLGFVVSTLITEGARKLRLHFWPLAGAAQQSPAHQIHDHLFQLRSWVLAGAVENVEYAACPTGGKEFAVYTTTYSGDCSILKKTDATLRLTERRRCTYNAGKSYVIDVGVLHETVRIGYKPALTVLVTTDRSAAPPIVLGPLSGQSLYVYERRIFEEGAVEDMLAAF
jgi:hypothetical protein